MNTEEIYQELTRRQVKISVSGDLLTFSAPPGALTPELIASMKRCKQDLIKLVKAQAGVVEPVAHAYSASYGQEALWLLHLANPTSASYNTAATLRILSPLNAASLQVALSKLQSRHEMLRAVFSQRDSALKVEIQSQPTLDFRVVDASRMDEAQLSESVNAEYSIPFDLKANPPFRARLFTQSVERHVLLLVFHHIIFDAFSLWILQRELQQLYQADLTGCVCLQQALPAQYSDFVAWQRELLASEEGERQWTFWRTQLAGDPAPAELPWTFPRNRHGERRGATHSFQLDEESSGAVRRLARRLGATPFATLMAVFQTLIHRYSGQQDFVVGTTTSGRSQRQFDQSIGYFVNILPIRSRLTDTTTFAELVQETKQRALGAMQAGDFPFSELVARLNPVRTANAPPLCRIMFGLQKPHSFTEVAQLLEDAQESIEWGGLSAQSYRLNQQEGQFDLTLEMYDAAKSFCGLLKYDRNLLSDEAAERLGRHYVALLQGVVADPSQRLTEYDLASPEEREQLIAWSSGPPLAVPERTRFDEWFADSAAQHPDSTALILGEQSWTYTELQRWSSHVARRFLELDVQPGDNVVVCLQRRALAPVCLLAAMKCGAAFVPVAHDSPTRRLEKILAECQPRLVVTEGDQRESIESLVAASTLVVPHDALESDRRTSPSPSTALDDPQVEFSPETAAYIIYTSGSSGIPKGVKVSHRALCLHVASMAAVYGMTKADRVLQFCEMTFDPSVEQLAVPWSVGAAVVVRPNTMYSGDGFWREVANQRITVANLPPSFFTECSQYVRSQTQLRLMIVGGDTFPNSCLPKWSQAPLRLLNAYGPTEAVVTATTCEVVGGDPSRSVPIGRPKPGSRALVLDREGRMAPIGVPGELCLAGPMLAEGYISEVGEVSQAFQWVAVDGRAPERVYRTGDLARWTDHGELEFLGRLDRQIKIRGFRVEPGEIESALLEHPGVGQAFAQLCEDGAHTFLAAYVAPSGKGELSRESVVRHLKVRLPLYMVPERLGILDSLPLNHSGKVAVERLPNLPRPTPSSTQAYVAPRTEVERIMARIWGEVLEAKSVGVNDDFLDLGGGSLQSLRIISRMNEAGVTLRESAAEMEPHLLFQFGTIAELAPLLQLSPQREPLTHPGRWDNSLIGSS